jgi:hypothetical protein
MQLLPELTANVAHPLVPPHALSKHKQLSTTSARGSFDVGLQESVTEVCPQQELLGKLAGLLCAVNPDRNLAAFAASAAVRADDRADSEKDRLGANEVVALIVGSPHVFGHACSSPAVAVLFHLDVVSAGWIYARRHGLVPPGADVLAADVRWRKVGGWRTEPATRYVPATASRLPRVEVGGGLRLGAIAQLRSW